MLQLLHTGPVLEIKVRGHSADGTQEVLIIYSDCIVVRIDGTAIVSLLQAALPSSPQARHDTQL